MLTHARDSFRACARSPWVGRSPPSLRGRAACSAGAAGISRVSPYIAVWVVGRGGVGTVVFLSQWPKVNVVFSIASFIAVACV